MRIIHTADWHLGKTLYGKNRGEEEIKALGFLKKFIEENDVEVLIIAGDVFDKFIPSSQAEEILFDFFIELYNIGTKVVMISGNHDSGIRFSSFAQVLKLANIYSFGKATRNSYVEIISKEGESVIFAAVPFIREAELMNIEDYELPSYEVKSKYAEKMGAIFNFIKNNIFRENSINILTSHLLVEYAKISGTEHKFYLANSYAVPPLLLPDTADYIALGHIHKFQKIETHVPTYYSGSLFPLDFGEQDDKGFLFFESKPGFPLEHIEFVPIPHKELKVLNLKKEDIETFIEKYKDFDGYIKIILDTDGQNLSGTIEKIKKIVPQVLSVQISKMEMTQKRELSVDDILDPIKSYISYYREKKQIDPPPKVIETFQELYKEVIEDED